MVFLSVSNFILRRFINAFYTCKIKHVGLKDDVILPGLEQVLYLFCFLSLYHWFFQLVLRLVLVRR